MIGRHPFTSSIRPIIINSLAKLEWSDPRGVLFEIKDQALLAIYSFATPLYKTIMSLLNINCIQKIIKQFSRVKL